MNTPTTIPAMFGTAVRDSAGRTAVIDERDSVSYRELDSLALAAARSLRALGVGPGDMVAGLMRNRIEWVACFLGCTRIGATYVPLNTWYTPSEIAWTLRHTGARVVISEPSFLKHDYVAMFAELEPGIARSAPGEIHGQQLPGLRTLVYLDASRPGAFGWEAFLGLGRDASEAEIDERTAAVTNTDPSLVLYTSGSTAEPKGVLLPHGGVTANGYGIGDRRGIESGDTIWLGSPLFYGLGATNCLPVSLSHGATLLLQDRFDPDLALSRIERYQATVYYGMSNMTRRIAETPGFARSRVQSLVKGTLGIEREERRLVFDQFGIAGATQSYGATETCGNCLGGFPDDPLELKLETCGKLLPGFDSLVVDPVSGEPLPDGQPGMLKVRGNVALGYLNNPAETSAAFDGDGFYATGDLGFFDADGYFRYEGRIKEIIKTGGINVSPAEIENLITSHSDITEAYVVGVPDRDRGESIVAFVVAAEGLSEADVQRHVRKRAAAFKSPHRVLFVSPEDVPRTASGKVARPRVREQAVAALGMAS